MTSFHRPSNNCENLEVLRYFVPVLYIYTLRTCMEGTCENISTWLASLSAVGACLVSSNSLELFPTFLLKEEVMLLSVNSKFNRNILSKEVLIRVLPIYLQFPIKFWCCYHSPFYRDVLQEYVYDQGWCGTSNGDHCHWVLSFEML